MGRFPGLAGDFVFNLYFSSRFFCVCMRVHLFQREAAASLPVAWAPWTPGASWAAALEAASLKGQRGPFPRERGLILRVRSCGVRTAAGWLHSDAVWPREATAAGRRIPYRPRLHADCRPGRHQPRGWCGGRRTIDSWGLEQPRRVKIGAIV